MARGKKKETVLTQEEKLQQALVPVNEQPYKVPENWRWVLLSEVVDLFNGDRGANYPSKKDYVLSGIPFINAGAIQEGKLNPSEYNYITQSKYKALRAGKVQKGDILYCLRGSLGKTAIVDFENQGAISSSLCILRIKYGVLLKYLYYLLNSNVVEHQQNSAENGSAQPNLSAASVLNYKLPLPPIPEQQRIVDRIESLFEKLDEAKEKAQAVVDGFEDRKAAILHKAFAGELTERWRVTNGIDASSWQHLRIADFAKVKGGKRLPKGCALTIEKTNHPYLRIADFGDDTIDLSDIHYITDDIYEQISRYIIEAGDVYISIVGTIGKCGTVPEELNGANLTENAARIITKRTLPRFLVGFLSSPVAQEDIKGRIRSATLGKLSLTNINSIIVPIPTKEEQKEIVWVLDKLLKSEYEAKESAEQVITQIDTMKKSILARAFRGELGTNDPSDESAEELLKRIL